MQSIRLIIKQAVLKR